MRPMPPKDVGFASSSAEPASAKILIVEDEAVVAVDLQVRLEELGFEICGTAPNRATALALAESHRPDLAIVDVRLAGRDDGIQIGSELHRTFGAAILYATANADEVRGRADVGLVVVLEKPYSIDAVLRGIRAARRLN